ncbi:hypothetical protein ID866_383 [Astraeus odoratus]|nr:hypothetical protein ID866_383 [Astraeus odoratus]
MSGPPGRQWQVVLPNSYTYAAFGAFSAKNAALNSSLVIPFYVASASAILLLLRIISSLYAVQVLRRYIVRIVRSSKQQVLTNDGICEDECLDSGRSLIADLGGLASATLLEASNHGSAASPHLEQLAGYASLLGLVSVTTRIERSRIAASHLVVVLLVLFSVYTYRDVYPFLTFTEEPRDLQEGCLIWAKVAVLTTIGVVLPVLCPTQYIPVDPASPSNFPHPEQTASWFSFSLYIWLDPIVYAAQRVSHLSHEKLPPLADYDHSRNLRRLNFSHLDSFTNKKKRHLFFGLVRVFRTECIILTFLVVLRVLSTLAAPVGINKLLLYIETGGEGATIRPWVWIVYIFAGQFVGSLIFQWYIFLTTRFIVRSECIITQLIFEHALRIRMKAELPDTGNGAIQSAVTTPDSASVADSSTVVGSSREDIPDDEQLTAASTSSVGTTKQKGKDEVIGKKPSSSADNLVGKINNLVTTDLGNIVDGRDLLLIFPYIPLQIALCIWFLYGILGWSAFVGLAVMIVLFPFPGMVANKIQSIQKTKMEKTDARVQTVTETMNVLRMVKLFGWEKKMDARISEKREVELVWTWKFKILELINNNVNFIIPLLTMMACYATYTLVMGEQLTASRVFSSMTVFDIMRDQLHMIFWQLPAVIQAKVSLARVNDFLKNTELLDCFAPQEENKPQIFLPEPEGVDSDAIGFRHAVFHWSSDIDGTLTPSKRKFSLRIDDELFFMRGCINLIVGPTGSGKTSLLMALLGEMHFVPSHPRSWFNLPRKGGVAYAAQESWVQNETIRDNILFGAPYDEARYKKVIYQCALERDLQLFEAGDRTEVGEKGLTLSGGQKARVTLARAVYSAAEILLLDDVLAALDVHTSKWIVEKCFGGDLIKDRTVILVTHNVAMTSSVAQRIITLTSNGRIASQGTVSDAIAKDDKLAAEIAKGQEALQRDEEEIDNPEEVPKKADGKLVMAEEILEGRVSWTASM